jgi:hypothetical protein
MDWSPAGPGSVMHRQGFKVVLPGARRGEFAGYR